GGVATARSLSHVLMYAPSLSPRRALPDKKCPARKPLVCFPPGGVAATRSLSRVPTYAPSLRSPPRLARRKTSCARKTSPQFQQGELPNRRPETKPGVRWWVWEELNFRPHPYQGCALTN